MGYWNNEKNEKKGYSYNVMLENIPYHIIAVKKGSLCTRLLLQFYTRSFETSHVFWSWSKNVHAVKI